MIDYEREMVRCAVPLSGARPDCKLYGQLFGRRLRLWALGVGEAAGPHLADVHSEHVAHDWSEASVKARVVPAREEGGGGGGGWMTQGRAGEEIGRTGATG